MALTSWMRHDATARLTTVPRNPVKPGGPRETGAPYVTNELEVRVDGSWPLPHLVHSCCGHWPRYNCASLGSEDKEIVHCIRIRQRAVAPAQPEDSPSRATIPCCSQEGAKVPRPRLDGAKSRPSLTRQRSEAGQGRW